jgi:hypothetical protein
MIKGWKHIKPFIEAEPRIAELTRALDLRLFWRQDTLWAGGVQLTFEYRSHKGEMVPLDSVEKKAAVALERLQMIEKARSEWPSLRERANRIIDEFDLEVVKPHKIQRKCFSVAQDNSLDSCAVFGGGIDFPPKEYQIILDLVGEPQLRGYGPTLDEAVADLRARAEREYGSGASPMEMTEVTNVEVCR